MTTPSQHTVELVLPPDVGYIRLARLVASGIASQSGLDVDAVSDFRIAVDEVCSTLRERGAGDLVLCFGIDDDLLRVSGSTTEEGDGAELDPERWRLARQILDVVVDGYDLDLDARLPIFRFHKQISARLRNRA